MCNKDLTSEFFVPVQQLPKTIKTKQTVCMWCIEKAGKEFAKKAKDKYEKICASRNNSCNKELEQSLWDVLTGKLGADDFDIDIDTDYIPFTNSEEFEQIMERYQEDLIKVLSGLENKLPEWYGSDEEE